MEGRWMDEEDCLGFDIFVAELELIVSSWRGRPDTIQLVELLQKLLASVARTDRKVLKQHQRRCESLITDLLTSGMGPAIRGLLSACLSQLYTHGDMISIYTRVSSLQSMLIAKDAATKPEVVRLGFLECLAYLSLHHGRSLASAASESIAIAVKTAALRTTPVSLRIACVQLAGAVVEGLNPLDRSATQCQADAYTLCKLNCRDRGSDDVRSAALWVLVAIARCGAAALWTNGAAAWEEAVKIAVGGLDDPTQAVREAAGTALGEMAACLRAPQLAEALAAEKKALRQAALSRLATTPAGLHACLVQPSVEAAVSGRRDAVAAAATGWLAYIAAVQQRAAASSAAEADDALLEAAQAILGMCDSAGRVVASQPGAGAVIDLLGAGEACWELPMATAACVYVIRCGVIDALPEPGQRALLQRLTAMATRCCPPGATGAAGSATVSGPVLSTPAQAAVLQVLACLLETLSEVDMEAGAALESSVATLVSSSPLPLLRHLAASVLSALAVAMPMAASKMLGSMLAGLDHSCQRLAARPATPPPNSSAAQAQAAATSHMDAMHGFSVAVAQLLVSGTRLPLGLPSSLAARVQHLAERCILAPLSGTWSVGCAAERAVGYTLLGALMSGSHPDDASQAAEGWCRLLVLALGDRCSPEVLLEERSGGGLEGVAEVAGQLRWRCVALQAVVAYLDHVVCRGLTADPLRQVAVLAEALAPLLQTVSSTPWLQDPHAARGGPQGALAAAAASLQRCLLSAYAALPLDSAVLVASHSPLINLCLSALKGGHPIVPAASSAAAAAAGALAATAALAQALSSSCLRVLLNKDDVPLGPWLPGRDALQDELRCFKGERGGPLPPPWCGPGSEGDSTAAVFAGPGLPSSSSVLWGSATGQPGIYAVAPSAAGNSSGRRVLHPFLPAQGLGCALLEAKLLLLGKLLATMSLPNQLQVCDVLLQAVSACRALPDKEPATAVRRLTVCESVAVVALAGLRPLARRTKGSAEASDQLAEKVLALGYALLDNPVSEHLALARAVAEVLGAAAGVASDALAVRIVRQVAADIKGLLVDNSAAGRRATLCLALGCCHRSKGGLALAATVPVALEVLTGSASRPTVASHLWALHGLWLLANASGLAFVASVRATLSLCQELVASAADGPLLRAAVARLANAMVAVLGPEFSLGSGAYAQAKSLITLNEGASADDFGSSVAPAGVVGLTSASGSASDGGPSSLQAVLFAQQLILFAPHAVPASKHVPMLQSALLSRRSGLRRAAAATLRHLAERDAAAILQEHLEPVLFLALDGEVDAAISAQLQATLLTLLSAGALLSPAYWLAVLGEVAFASSAGSAGAAALAAGGQAVGGAPQDDDPDDVKDSRAQAGHGARVGGAGYTGPQHTFVTGAAAAAAAAAAYRPGGADQAAGPPQQGAGGLDAATVKTLSQLATPRLRTRIFAAKCLLQMLRALSTACEASPGGGRTGGVAIAAPAAGSALERLSTHLALLIDMGFKLATGQVEVLKPYGVQLLELLVTLFAGVEDPLLEGARLIDQFQAQVVSALRSALTSGVAPTLSMAGGSLATTFLESGLAAGDSQVMRRLMDMLSAPLVAASADVAGWGRADSASHLYAEWVGVRSRVALLQAHAQCCIIAQSGRDTLMESIVVKAQRPLRGTLWALWTSLMHDAALLLTQPPAVLAGYSTSALLPPSVSPAVAAAVLPVYTSAWPATLTAVAANVPSPAELQDQAAGTAGGAGAAVGEGAAKALLSRSQFESVLDATLLCSMVASQELTERVQGNNKAFAAASERLLVSLNALHVLMSQELLSAGVVPLPVVCSLVEHLSAVAAHALHPALASRAPASARSPGATTRAPPSVLPTVTQLVHSASALLRNITSALPSSSFAAPCAAVPHDVVLPPDGTVADALTECVLCYASLAVPFTVLDASCSGSATASPPSGALSTLAWSERSVVLFDGGEGEALQACLGALLLAQEATLRRAPMVVLLAQLPAALHLGLRLLHCAPAGGALARAASWYQGILTLLVERVALESEDVGHTAGEVVQALAAAAAHLTQLLHTLRSAETLDSERLSTCLSAALCTSVALLGSSQATGSTPQAASIAHAGLLHDLALCLHTDGSCHAVQVLVLQALRNVLQESQADRQGKVKREWAVRMLCVVGPLVAALAQHLLAAHNPELSAEATQVVVECLSWLLRGSVLVAQRGPAAPQAIMQVMVPLLVSSACHPTPPLSASAISMVMQLSSPMTGATGVLFKTVLAALPLHAKQQLQGVLRQAAKATADDSAGVVDSSAANDDEADTTKALPAFRTASATGKPTIVLKTDFAMFARPK